MRARDELGARRLRECRAAVAADVIGGRRRHACTYQEDAVCELDRIGSRETESAVCRIRTGTQCRPGSELMPPVLDCQQLNIVL